MKIITINLPQTYLDVISKLQEMGQCESRSDFIRKALRRFVDKELNFNRWMEAFV